MQVNKQTAEALQERRRMKGRARQLKYRIGLKRRKLKQITILIDRKLLEEIDFYCESAGISRSQGINNFLCGSFREGDPVATRNWVKRGKLPTVLKTLAMVLDKAVSKDIEGLRAVLNE